MNETIRQVLCQLVAAHGQLLAGDRGLTQQLLGPHRASDPGSVALLIAAQDEGVASELAVRSGGSAAAVKIARLSLRLEEACLITAGAARWAVESWALALGALPRPEVTPPFRLDAPPRGPRPSTARETLR